MKKSKDRDEGCIRKTIPMHSLYYGIFFISHGNYPYNDSLEIEHGKINGLHALVLFEVTAEINRLDRK
ncbi:MAG: hypothetical protein HQL06_16380 [Nitrospirae bacterium]|nr:hypothetical protein [Nitrospirota bacterium]